MVFPQYGYPLNADELQIRNRGDGIWDSKRRGSLHICTLPIIFRSMLASHGMVQHGLRVQSQADENSILVSQGMAVAVEQ